MPNLYDKKKYILNYTLLLFFLRQSLKLKKIHRGIRYTETNFLENYIEFNTEKRTKAASDFEKDFYKLMNNAPDGKSFENVRNRASIKIVNGHEAGQLEKLFAKPHFQSAFVFEDSNLVSVKMGQSTVCLNRPIYLGQTILDNSKYIMYYFHYNYIKPKYADKAKLLMTDTDSLCYAIETEDFYKDIIFDVEDRFDASNYDSHHPSGIPTGKNKKVPGMMKDEAGGKFIIEFVGLRPKLYAFTTQDTCVKKCKGVRKPVIEKWLNFDHYKDCLFNKTMYMTKYNMLKSRKHEITTEMVTKVALTGEDDKRFLLQNSRHETHSLGHWINPYLDKKA